MALPPLATTDDLAARYPGPLPPPPERVDAMLADASAAVRAYCGQDFTQDTTTEWLVLRDPLILPQRPVNDVTDVVNLAGEPVGWAWDGLDRLDVDPFAGPTVGVTYDHGYTELPPDVVAVVCNVAARGLASSPGASAVTQESITNYSVSYGTISAAGPTGFFAGETAVLDRYRRTVGVTWMAR